MPATARRGRRRGRPRVSSFLREEKVNNHSLNILLAKKPERQVRGRRWGMWIVCLGMGVFVLILKLFVDVAT